MRRLLPALALVALIVLPARAATHWVTIRDSRYDPATTTAVVNDAVVWENQGTQPHTVTADDGSSFDYDIPPTGTRTHGFETPGTYGYHCKFHPSMRGTVVVQPASTTSSSSTTTTRPSTTTTRRTTTTAAASGSSVTAPRDRTATTSSPPSSSTSAPEDTTTTTAAEDDTITLVEEDGDEAASSPGPGPGDNSEDPSHAGHAAVAALLLAAVSGSAALAVRKGL